MIESNEIVGAGSQFGSGGALWQSDCGTPATGTVALRRNQWQGGIGSAAEHLSLISSGTGTLLFTDSLVAGGTSDGVVLEARGTSTLRVTNATIADHGGTGVVALREPGATTSIYNTIVFGNGTDSAPIDVALGSNLFGVDPLFTGTQCRPGAPAIDAGTPSPPGGLGPSDLVGSPRTIGAAPDIGAIEVPEARALASALAAAAALAALRARRPSRAASDPGVTLGSGAS